MDPWIIAIAFTTFLLTINPSKAQITENDGMFTSTTDLERLLFTEAELVRALKNYVQQEEQRLVKIRQ